MKKHKSESGVPDSIGDVAVELEADVASFESLTARVSRMQLSTEKDILRAAEVLGEAAESHKRFLEHLRDLIVQIDNVRNRQNASASALSEYATKLEERRQTYQALQERFSALGNDAHEVNELVVRSANAGRDTPEERRAALEGLRAARERLKSTVEAARTVVEDARAAELTDVERQADSLRQQLQSLQSKLHRVELALGEEPPAKA